MKHFDYFAPTEIIFGAGRVTEAGALAARYGKKAMLVTVPEFPAVAELYAKVKKSLSDAGVACVHYDGVIPNPTTELVTRGAELAKAEGVDVVIGLGGGSSMDTRQGHRCGGHPSRYRLGLQLPHRRPNRSRRCPFWPSARPPAPAARPPHVPSLPRPVPRTKALSGTRIFSHAQPL